MDGRDDRIAAPPHAAVAVLLALLCAALYANARDVPFIGDDYAAIVENPAVRWREWSLDNARSALARAEPLAQLSYGINYRLGRLDVRGYHALNTALHFANALLVYTLGLVLFQRTRALSAEAAPWAAFAGAALFAAHPLQTEAVTWLARRETLLSALLGLALAQGLLRVRAAGLRAARAGLFSASALAAAIALGACVALHGQAPAIALYEGLVVWPLPARLSLAHELPLGAGSALALHAVILFGAAAVARRFPMIGFGVLWFYLWQVVAAWGAATPAAAEHRSYLALAGPALAFASAIYAALPRRLGTATAVSVVAVGLLGAATHARNELWRDPEALWNDAVNKSPRDATARLERGTLFEQSGRADDALADFTKAVEHASRSTRARVALAAHLAARGRARDALPHALEAVALDPRSGVAYAALGRIQAALGQLESAAQAFERALALGGGPALERNLGDTLVRLRRFEAALPYYRAALERDPGDDDARAGAGAALVELGRAREALAELEHAVESAPNPRYLVHFADALWQLGDAGAALDAAVMAVRFAPSWPDATSRLAWLIALAPDRARRDPERAQRIADTALEQAGPHALLLAARAAALAAAGHFDAARADTERASMLAREAGDGALADALAAHAASYARREVWSDPPRPFEASP